MDFKAFIERIKSAQPRKWSDRQRLLNARDLALDGKLYAHIANPFTREFKDSVNEDRISLDDRRASVQDRLPLVIARGFANMLFGEGHRPVPFVRNDDATNAWIMAFIKDTNLWWHLWKAALHGQSGSVAIVLRVLAKNTFTSGDPNATQSSPGRYFLEVWDAVECSPVFKPWAPTDLESLERTYFVRADNLRARGYDVDALEEKWQAFKYGRTAKAQRLKALAQANAGQPQASLWWAMRLRLEENAEVWYEPIPKWLYDSDDWNDRTEWPIDNGRSFAHSVGEVCAIWIVNGPERDECFPDGLCTFEPAIDFQFRIDRTLSQTGRAFDYAGDPQVAEIEGATGSTADGGGDWDAPEDSPGATASDTLKIPAGGDAKFLEIHGEGLKVAIETYVDKLRQIAREVCAGSRIDPETAGSELSGAAMYRLNEAMVGMVGVLKLSYGDRGIEPLLRLGMRLYEKVKVQLPSFEAMLTELLERRARAEAQQQTLQQTQQFRAGQATQADGQPAASPPEPVEPKDIDVNVSAAQPKSDAYIETKWPQPYTLTGTEKQAEVAAIVGARDGKIVTQETAVAASAGIFDVANPDQELADIQAESAASEERELSIAESHAKITAAYQVTPE